MLISRFGKLLVLTLILTMTAVASAQDHQPVRIGPDSQRVELVKTGLFVVSGAGGNTAVRLSGNGIILVDGQLPGHYRDLVARIGTIADELPVRMLITTNQDEVHAGTNADFLMHGIPVLAQEKARKSLLAGDSAQNHVALPSVTFGEERTIKLGGVTVQLFYFGPAHTDADAVVYFPDLKVIAVGDLYTRATPYVEFDSGGSLLGWATALERILQLDFDRVVPGFGPLADRAELQTFKAKLDATVSRATHLVSMGISKDRLMAQLHTDDLGWQFDFTGSRLEAFYRELALRDAEVSRNRQAAGQVRNVNQVPFRNPRVRHRPPE